MRRSAASCYNAGTEPVTRYLARVAVDRYPNDPGRSNRHHREHPLTFAELRLQARRDDGGGDPEPMHWRAKHDRDAFKEIWLLFENGERRFPLYPGDRATIEYAYSVGHEKWGPWFQRAVRLPTRQLAVRLDLPAALDPQVWGVETSLSAEEGPLRTAPQRHDEGDRAIFDWADRRPAAERPLPDAVAVPRPPGDRTRRRPRRASGSGPATGCAASASCNAAPTCSAAGPPVRPARGGTGRPGRGRPARRRPWPGSTSCTRSARGWASPPRSSASAGRRPWSGPADRSAEPVVLLNPRVVDADPDTDEQYEGCLSFFDLRGLVPRPLRLDVEHAQWDGSRIITSFEFGMARLVAHEIDHLEGRLYVDRMAPGVPLVPVEEYRETGHPWRY